MINKIIIHPSFYIPDSSLDTSPGPDPLFPGFPVPQWFWPETPVQLGPRPGGFWLQRGGVQLCDVYAGVPSSCWVLHPVLCVQILISVF